MESSIQQLIFNLESRISEGLSLFPDLAVKTNSNLTNDFIRHLKLSKSYDIAYIQGLALSGIRSAAIINGTNFHQNLAIIKNAVRQHLPFIVHYVTQNTPNEITFNHINEVLQSGAFIFAPTNLQELIDITIISRLVTEQSLVPGFLYTALKDNSANLSPDKKLLIDFLGSPDDIIASPTPAQEIIFGTSRKRVPKWYNFDYPVMLSPEKDPFAHSCELASQQIFFNHHLEEILVNVFEKFNKISGSKHAFVKEFMTDDAEHIIISYGEDCSLIEDGVKDLRSKKVKVGCISLLLLNPFPSASMVNLIKKAKSITLIEPSGAGVPGKTFLYGELCNHLYNLHIRPKIYSGIYASEISIAKTEAVFHNMIASQPKEHFFVDVSFMSGTGLPKHQILNNSIKKAYKHTEQFSIYSNSNNSDHKTKEVPPADLPIAIRKYVDKGPVYSRLSHFYNHTAWYYENRHSHQPTADPFQAVPVVPSSTAYFDSAKDNRKMLPQFIPECCTGCGVCYTYCPHSAIPPIAISIGQLLKSGMELSAKNGATITQLTPHLKTLNKYSCQLIEDDDEANKNLNDVLLQAFETFVEKKKPDPEKAALLEIEFNSVRESLKDFPMAVTDTFFNEPNAIKKDSGELFSLAIDLNACTGCGLCEKVCATDALKMEDVQEIDIASIKNTFKLWEQLPDTSGETINQLVNNKEYNPISAIQLSRSYYLTITGGGYDKNNFPDKITTHVITSATEAYIQPIVIGKVKEIQELSEKLSGNIRDNLSEFLPKKDFNGVLQVLKTEINSKISIDNIMEKLKTHEQIKLVDRKGIERKIVLKNQLENLQNLLTEGHTGTGRARYGVVILNKQNNWQANYPFNHFTVPVVNQNHLTDVEMLSGIFEGHLRSYLDNIKLIHRARLEIKNKYDSLTHDSEIASLSWGDLSDSDKSFIPPIILITDSKNVNYKLNKILNQTWPIKIFILDDGVFTPDSNSLYQVVNSMGHLLSSFLNRKAFVFQGSIGSPHYLFNNLIKGLQHQGPALFNLLAPNLDQYQTEENEWLGLFRLALKCRSFPEFHFEPQRMKSLSSCLNIENNPSYKELWHTENLSYKEKEGNEKKIAYQLTWADWAVSLKAWEKHFLLCDDEKPNTLPIAEYLNLSSEFRKDYTPVIFSVQKDKIIKYMVSEDVIKITEATLDLWNHLREIGGELTDFPEKLELKLRKEYDEKYRQEFKNAEKLFEQKLRKQEEQQLDSMKQRLKEKLIQLTLQAK